MKNGMDAQGVFGGQVSVTDDGVLGEFKARGLLDTFLPA